MDIDSGLVTALIGPSGCGKSTFLRSSEPHERRDGRLTGRRGSSCWKARTSMRRRWMSISLRSASAWCSRSPTLFPSRSIDNVAYGPRSHGLGEQSTICEEIVERACKARHCWTRSRTACTIRPGTVRRPAAAAVHRAGHRYQPGGPADGRALFGAGPAWRPARSRS